MIGSIDAADPSCRYFVDKAGVSVASVEYRLAPEHPFPVPLEDVYAAIEWVVVNALILNGDPNQVAVGGVSAGANLVAAATLLARNRGGPKLACQLLGMPITECSFDTLSYDEYAHGSDLTRADMRYFWDCYLSSDIDAKNPYAAPLRERNLSGLPPALVVTGEYDPLRDDGVRYVDRLEAAGVKVRHQHHSDAPHGVLGSGALASGVTPTERAFSEMVDTLSTMIPELSV